MVFLRAILLLAAVFTVAPSFAAVASDAKSWQCRLALTTHFTKGILDRLERSSDEATVDGFIILPQERAADLIMEELIGRGLGVRLISQEPGPSEHLVAFLSVRGTAAQWRQYLTEGLTRRAVIWAGLVAPEALLERYSRANKRRVAVRISAPQRLMPPMPATRPGLPGNFPRPTSDPHPANSPLLLQGFIDALTDRGLYLTDISRSGLGITVTGFIDEDLMESLKEVLFVGTVEEDRGPMPPLVPGPRPPTLPVPSAGGPKSGFTGHMTESLSERLANANPEEHITGFILLANDKTLGAVIEELQSAGVRTAYATSPEQPSSHGVVFVTFSGRAAQWRNYFASGATRESVLWAGLRTSRAVLERYSR